MNEIEGGMRPPVEAHAEQKTIVPATPKEAGLLGRLDHLVRRTHQAEAQLERGEPHVFVQGGEVIFQMDQRYVNALRHAQVEAYEDAGAVAGFAAARDVVEQRRQERTAREDAQLADVRRLLRDL